MNTTPAPNKHLAAAIGAALLATVLLANYVTTHFGLVPVGFGLVATAGTYLAGAMFVLRDALQDTAGKRTTLAVLVLGAAVSFAVADPFIALASAAAFLFSELANMAIYTPLRKRGYVRAAVTSNVIAAFLDTILFLAIAGFPIMDAIAGQMIGKVAVTAAVVGVVIIIRAVRNTRQQATA